MPTDAVSNKASTTAAEGLKASGNHTDHAEGNALLFDRKRTVRKVPVPSSNPNDALNFRPSQKWGVIIICCWFCETWAHMVQSITSPAILFVVLASSISLAGTVCMFLTYDTVLQSYGWQPRDIGLINIASIIGGLLGSACWAVLGELVALWLAKRNHGIHKPEHRLILLASVGILGVAMLDVYGFRPKSGVEGTVGSYWGALLGWGLFQTVTSPIWRRRIVL